MPVQPGEIKSDYDAKYGFSDKEDYVFKARRGLDRKVVEDISAMKKEPAWMREFRLKALDIFLKKPMPTWGNTPSLQQIDFANIFYYMKPSERTADNWEDVPEYIKNTFDKLGIPEA